MAEDKTQIVHLAEAQPPEAYSGTFNVRDRVMLRALSAAALSAALAAPVLPYGNGEHIPQAHETAAATEAFHPHDNHGNAVTIGDGMKITLGSAEQTGPKFYTAPLAPQQVTERVADLYCKTPNTTIPNYLDYGEISKGAHTEFALSYDDAEAIKTQLAKAGTIEESQAIATDMFASLGIQTSFDNIRFDRDEKVMPYTPATYTNETQVYAHQVATLANMLTRIPREMTKGIDSIDLLSQDVIAYKDKRKPLAEGLYHLNGIQLAIYSEDVDYAMVHELAHGVHDRACSKANGDYTDPEFVNAYNQAIALLQPGPVRQTYAPYGTSGLDSYELQEREQHNMSIGFPTEYSKENYIELFAELTTALITKGSLIDGAQALPDNQNARKLQALVIERLQKEMPHTDVASYLQFTDYYNAQFQYPQRPLEDFVDNRVAPMDRVFGMYDKMSGQDTYTVEPAIAVEPGNGMPEQYIYAVFNTKTSDDAFAQINVFDPNPSVRQSVMQAGANYMLALQHKHPELRGLKLTAQESGTTVYISLQPENTPDSPSSYK